MERACQGSKYYDDLAGWRWNEGKGQTFARGRTGHAAGDREHDDICARVGRQKHYVEILGVTLSMRRGPPVVCRRKSEAAALHQLGRIALACPGHSNWARRLKVAAMLVVPKLKWGGRWQRPPVAKVRSWDTAIQRAVLKPPRTSSRAASGAIISLAGSAEFQLDLDSLRRELWRPRRRARGLEVREGTPARWREVLRKWDWQPRPEEDEDTLGFVAR